MVIQKTELKGDIYYVYSQEITYSGPVLGIWKKILDESSALGAKAIIHINPTDFVIGVMEIRKLVDLINSYENLAAVANVKFVLPEADQIQSYTNIKQTSSDLDVKIQVFYDEKLALEWIKNCIDEKFGSA